MLSWTPAQPRSLDLSRKGKLTVFFLWAIGPSLTKIYVTYRSDKPAGLPCPVGNASFLLDMLGTFGISNGFQLLNTNPAPYERPIIWNMNAYKKQPGPIPIGIGPGLVQIHWLISDVKTPIRAKVADRAILPLM